MSDVVDIETAEEVVVECELDGPPEKVWRALTVPELFGEWLDIPKAADAPSYEIVEALPFSRVRYAWNDPTVSEQDSFVTFELAPLPGGRTRFRLTHGVEAFARAPLAAANSNGPSLALAA